MAERTVFVVAKQSSQATHTSHHSALSAKFVISFSWHDFGVTDIGKMCNGEDVVSTGFEF